MSVSDYLALIGLLIGGLLAFYRFYKIEKDKDALTTRCNELEKQLKKDHESFVDALNQARAHYDYRIEGQKQEIDRLHKAVSRMARIVELRREATKGGLFPKEPESKP